MHFDDELGKKWTSFSNVKTNYLADRLLAGTAPVDSANCLAVRSAERTCPCAPESVASSSSRLDTSVRAA